ncbi:MAG: hypothetical protein GY757_30440, partial [bacterium]|nr:hypothetical protein [bacterium]
KEFRTKITLAEIFGTPTIRELSQYLRNVAQDEYTTIGNVEKREYYAISSAQKRMYVLQQIDKNTTTYNIPTAVELKAKLDKNRLEKILGKLIERHESLRTCFKLVKNEPAQVVYRREDIPFAIEYYETGTMDESITRFIRPFDLSQAPLFRAGVMKTADARYYLAVDMHHIIADGVSHHVLVKDFLTLDNGHELPPMKLQYKDYSHWE